MADTAEVAPSPELDPYALYRYFDVRDILLYVGISGDLAVRDKSHISRSRWMQLTARSTVERHKTLEDVKKAEREAIETEHPLFNVVYNNTPEAKRRLRAYLEEIGRGDLLYSKQASVRSRGPSEEEYDAIVAEIRSRYLSPAPPDEQYDPEWEGYVDRWRREAEQAWWRPWLEDDCNWQAPDDLLGLICPEFGITEALGQLLDARRRGQDWPMVWVTESPVWDEHGDCDGYAWSAHVDFTFFTSSDHEGAADIIQGELAAQRELAEALEGAQRCRVMRLGEQVVLSGFQDKTEAQLAGAILRSGTEVMLQCVAQIHRLAAVQAA